MMTFKQLSLKLYDKNYRRNTSARMTEDENGNLVKIYDFEHKRRLDMFSVYLDEFDQVLYAEFTKVELNRSTNKFSQQVTKLTNNAMIEKFLA